MWECAQEEALLAARAGCAVMTDTPPIDHAANAAHHRDRAMAGECDSSNVTPGRRGPSALGLNVEPHQFCKADHTARGSRAAPRGGGESSRVLKIAGAAIFNTLLGSRETRIVLSNHRQAPHTREPCRGGPLLWSSRAPQSLLVR